jgi:hypothetical protein
MPTWSEILTELRLESAKSTPNVHDFVRKKYLKKLSTHTKRNTILYSTAFTVAQGNYPAELLSIVEEDVQGMMEVSYQLDKSQGLDLILHSPGGSPEAAEGIVNYLHEQFESIRVIIPQLAMSAATMIACSGHSILMGKHSSLGPVDPQLMIQTGHSVTSNPAKAIIDQFYKALSEVGQPDKQAWSILLGQYGPSLIVQCENYIEMSRELVEEWLKRWMFNGQPFPKTPFAIFPPSVFEPILPQYNHFQRQHHPDNEIILANTLGNSSALWF